MLSQYGIKIKNYSCGALYEYNLGVREYLPYTNAMFTNNLFSYFLAENGLKVSKDGRTRDIICINFDYGAKSYEETKAKIERSIELQLEEIKNNKTTSQEKAIERVVRLKEILQNTETNKHLYQKKSKEQIRQEFYQDGVNITYTTKDNDGNIKKQETIHYKMLYRSTGKAKLGSCMFVCDRLYKKAHDFLSVLAGRLISAGFTLSNSYVNCSFLIFIFIFSFSFSKL